MKQLTKVELLDLFDPAVHGTLAWWMQMPGVEALVVFENVMMDSSAFGERTATPVGARFTFTSVEACEGKWLNDLPSQRQHATSFFLIQGETKACGGAVR